MDHVEKYAEGVVPTDVLENVCSLRKRSIKGACVGVAPLHLYRYREEQSPT